MVSSTAWTGSKGARKIAWTEFTRTTVADEVRFSGHGLHSGAPVEIVVAPHENGIEFSAGSVRVRATPENVTDTTRCTCLGPVQTVEHLLSALAGLGVTDALIHVQGSELPALDGSSREYALAVAAIGTRALSAARIHGLFERCFAVSGEARVAIGAGTGHWRYDFECGERWPHSQTFEASLDPETYLGQVSGARTFAFEEEVAPLRAAGLGQGLDETSCLILGQEGYLNEPHWHDEPARHKLLDLIGDLSLAGVPVTLLNVVAVRSGHTLNVEAARRLAAQVTIET